eukprot:1150977-Pelagomonas_calceolata.AAC.3
MEVHGHTAQPQQSVRRVIHSEKRRLLCLTSFTDLDTNHNINLTQLQTRQTQKHFYTGVYGTFIDEWRTSWQHLYAA